MTIIVKLPWTSSQGRIALDRGTCIAAQNELMATSDLATHLMSNITVQMFIIIIVSSIN